MTLSISFFHNCSAGFGGGLVVSSMQSEILLAGNHFKRNIASSNLSCPVQQCIEFQTSAASRIGGGGAMHVERAPMTVAGWVSYPFSFEENYASHRGGGIYVGSRLSTASPQGATLRLVMHDYLGKPSRKHSSVSGFPPLNILADQVFGYYNSFVSNSAGLAGGAIASDSSDSFLVAGYSVNGPNVYTLFSGNSAPVGGAMSLVNTPSNLTQVLFLGNSATPPGTHSGVSSAYGCGQGHGGAVCLVGNSPSSSFGGKSLIFINNTATFGGALSLHASPSCSADQLRDGCFTATLDSYSNFTGNAAVGGGAGGAIFWAQPGNLVVTCNSSLVLPHQLNAPQVFLNITEGVQPCTTWGINSVDSEGYGPVVASTPYFLTPGVNIIPFYRSNLQISMNVSTQVSHVVVLSISAAPT